jgi:hypothetical protein
MSHKFVSTYCFNNTVANSGTWNQTIMRTIQSVIFSALLFLALQPSFATQTNNGEFNTFWRAFKTAIARNNKQAIADMTKLPFMLDGKNEDRAGFLKQFNSLFTRKMKRCIATAKPLKEGDYYEIFCGEQIFLFAKDTDGKFKFTEIGVND